MQTTLRQPSLLRNAAGRNTLIQLITEQCSLRQPSTFPLRKFTTSRPTPSRLPHTSTQSVRPTWQHRASPLRSRRLPGGLRSNSNTTNTHIPSPAPKSSGGGRIKDLTRKYGWAALGVYVGLSALDFPFCYLAVRWLGSDRIAAAEEWVVDGFWTVTETAMPGSRERVGVWWEQVVGMWREFRGMGGVGDVGEGSSSAVEGVEEVRRHGKGHEASLWTQLALAYALHKSLIVFRLPLTAAVTPGIVKWLRKRGWNIGRPKA